MKPGYTTTEFFVVVLTNVGLVAAAAAEWLPPRYAAIGSAVATAAYAIARGLAKQTQPPYLVAQPPAPPAPPAA